MTQTTEFRQLLRQFRCYFAQETMEDLARLLVIMVYKIAIIVKGET